MILTFKDRGWDVLTQSWTVATNRPNSIEIAYLWGDDGVGWTSNATGVSRASFNMTLEQFKRHLNQAVNVSVGVLDLGVAE